MFNLSKFLIPKVSKYNDAKAIYNGRIGKRIYNKSLMKMIMKIFRGFKL